MGFGLRQAKRLSLGVFAACLLAVPVVRSDRTESILPLVLAGFSAGLVALICQVFELETAIIDDEEIGP